MGRSAVLVRGATLGLMMGGMAAGCTPVGVAVGAAASVGVTAAQDGGIAGGIEDTRIRLAISDAWLKQDQESWDRLSLMVWDRRALVMGKLPDPAKRAPAIAAARAVKGVAEVIDEIRIGDGKAGIDGRARDYLLSTSLRTALALDRDIDALNIGIETHFGVIYLIGSARNPQEIRRITDHARTLRGVKAVVSHIRVRPPKPPGKPDSAPSPAPGSES